MAHSEDVVPHAHNEILEIIVKTGLAGFIFVLLAVILCVRMILAKLRRSSGNDRAILVGYACALFAVCIENLTDMTLRTIPVAFSFWMVLGLSLRDPARRAKEISFTPPRWTRTWWMIPVFILPAVPVVDVRTDPPLQVQGGEGVPSRYHSPGIQQDRGINRKALHNARERSGECNSSSLRGIESRAGTSVPRGP